MCLSELEMVLINSEIFLFKLEISMFQSNVYIRNIHIKIKNILVQNWNIYVDIRELLWAGWRASVRSQWWRPSLRSCWRPCPRSSGGKARNSSVLKYYIYTILLFSIPGVPGEDYPIYAEVPETAFSCSGQVDGGESEYFLHLKYFHYWVWNISHSDGESLSLSEYFYFVAKNVSCTQYRVQCNGQLGHSMVGNQGGQGVSTDVSQYTCEKVKALVRIPILIRF